MKKAPFIYRAGVPCILAGLLTLTPESAQAALSDGLVSYWPLEEVAGGKTPDLVNGYDMTLNNLTAADLVAGHVGQCFNFSNAKQTLLSRIHGPNDDLPANKHTAFTISFWAKVKGTGQVDLRLFSEGFNPNNTNPLFNIGTHNGGSDDSVDLFIRNGTVETVNHIKTIAQPFDDTWHHITYIQRADGSRKLYVDGVADELEIPARPPGEFPINDTTIGGILRSSASHWVTGLIDEVAIWKRDLTDAEINQVKSNGLVSLFPPEAKGLVAHWPMDQAAGGKTPDLVNGYDMTLNNLEVGDLVDGKSGKCFNFSNAKQSLLSRIHGANDELPANKHTAFTVAFWSKVKGTGQSDLRLFSEGFNPNNTNPLFNIGTHNTGTDDSVDLFIRNGTVETVNHLKTTAQPFDDTWHHVTYIQRADGSRKLYVDGVADELEIPARPEGGLLPVNNTTIGGILRASPSHWVTGLIDEVAIWKRDLTEAEIVNIKANGVPTVLTKKQPLELKLFTTDFPAAATGDKVVLRWEGSKDANYAITPGIGDVTGQTAVGTGNKEIVVNATSTYTLTATRGSESLAKQVTVRAVAGVTPGWHLLDTFDHLTPGSLFVQSDWLGAEGLFSVVDKGGNKAVGFDDGTELTALNLRSFTIPEGQKGTLSFRVYVEPIAAENPITLLATHVGLTERSIRFNGDFNANVGPYIRVDRIIDGSTVDLQARNGVATGTYEGQANDALQPGKWYRLWIDVENKPFDVVDGTQNGGDRYSVYIQKDGDAARTTLFSDYLADRDAISIDPALGAPTKDLTHVFISVPGNGQGVNPLLFDEFFVSVGADNATVPYVPVVGPTEITITGSSYNATTGAFTVAWGSLTGVSYTIQKKAKLGDAWTTAAAGQPVGGATGASASYTDAAAGGGTGFYRVIYVP